jgi:hypothetical protein
MNLHTLSAGSFTGSDSDAAANMTVAHVRGVHDTLNEYGTYVTFS